MNAEPLTRTCHPTLAYAVICKPFHSTLTFDLRKFSSSLRYGLHSTLESPPSHPLTFGRFTLKSVVLVSGQRADLARTALRGPQCSLLEPFEDGRAPQTHGVP